MFLCTTDSGGIPNCELKREGRDAFFFLCLKWSVTCFVKKSQ